MRTFFSATLYICVLLVTIYFPGITYAQNIKQQASYAWKISPGLSKEWNQVKPGQNKFIVSGTQLENLLTKLQQHGDEIRILQVDRPSHSFIVQCKPAFARSVLVSFPEVIFIDILKQAHPEINIIGYDRSFHGINAVDHLLHGANGKNIVIGVKEQNMESADLDLWKRVLPSAIASPTVTNHATVIASIIGGAGNSFYDGRGIAWGSRFFPSSFGNLFPDDATILNANKVTVQNHSYGTVIQQFYGAEAVSYDVQTSVNKNMMHIFSAGNRGTEFTTEGKYANIPGFANLTGNFKMAKNILTVGAIDNKENIPAESSAGPLYDGRLAPQLTALGPNGTSDAAGIVSGTIGVMQQVYADSNNQSIPPASLIKAILYNSAQDIHNKGIDFKTGYGLLDSYSSVLAIREKEYEQGFISQGQAWTKDISVPPGIAQLKLTLAWTDVVAPVNNIKALISDLDLELEETVTGTIYRPWVLSVAASRDSLVKEPVRKRDTLNTAEQISVSLPPAGLYRIKVYGANGVVPNQPFHIAYRMDTLNTFYFTNPQHPSDINRAENETLTIRWKTFVADTNQSGNLFASYDNGTTWGLIKALHKIHTTQYRWQIPDTSATVLFKMETTFGSFFSKQVVLSKTIQPVVDYLCADSFRLSWNRHIYANAYRLYTLTDSPYLKPIRDVTDTFTVINRQTSASMVYAIEPILSNSLPASRSVAIDIGFQGVKCFYRTFFYDVFAGNTVNLRLELSLPAFTDSIYFEKISATGQLIQTIGGVSTVAISFNYGWLTDQLPPGTTYFRARIKLKSGQFVFTEIISVLTSGSRYVVLYPNPVSRDSNLDFLFQQGVPSDTELKLFDITGRLLKTINSLSGSIEMAKYPAGILFYQVVSRTNGILETGKILVL